MALAVSAWRDSRARSVRIQPSSAAINGLIRSCRTACRCLGAAPLISRSTAKISSMRRTASIRHYGLDCAQRFDQNADRQAGARIRDDAIMELARRLYVHMEVEDPHEDKPWEDLPESERDFY